MRRLPSILGLLAALTGTAAADPVATEGEESPPAPPAAPDAAPADDIPTTGRPHIYYALGTTTTLIDAETFLLGGQLEVGKPSKKWSSVWWKAHLARYALTDEDYKTDSFTELGAGGELRRCRWPALTCGGIGVVLAGTIEDDGDLSGVLVPYIDGELGIGQLAIRLGLEGRVGKALGVGVSAGLVLRL